MTAVCDIILAGLIEKDSNGDVLWTWSYPMVTQAQRELFMRKSCLSKPTGMVPFLYNQLDRQWYYFYTQSAEDIVTLPKVEAFSIILYAKDFNPEKYEALCKILCHQYCKTGSPASIVEVYLAVVTKGKYNAGENGTFLTQDYQAKQAYATANLLGIIETFGVETILLYTAVLLKKRVIVYFPLHSLPELLQFTRSLPAFVWHRQNWNIVYPFVELVDDELEHLRNSNHYVAGFSDATVETRSELYDVFVNGSTSQISVAQHAKETFVMGKLHKDIAMFMVKLAEGGDTAPTYIIKEIASKTKELLNNLKSLAGEDGTITLESFKERKMPLATENFLFTLAACEGLIRL